MRYQRIHSILFLLAILPYTVSAVEIARMSIQIGVNQYDLDLELYDSITPVTVTNFLKYADDGAGDFRYDNSFIHRSLPNFAIQGGGFTFDPLLGFGSFDYDAINDIYPGGLQEVPEYASIINEFTGSGLSNVRGTIAMAQVNTDPDSATSQWFINHMDNTYLDSDNYTVFGHVLGDGMAVVDQIAAVPVIDLTAIHPHFNTVPLDGYVNSDPVEQDNLVRVNSVTVIQRPILKSDTDSIDFAFVMLGTTTQKTIILRNTGNADLVMDGASLAALGAPFSIVTETCSNNTLSPESENPSDTCSVTIEFSPDTVGDYQDNLVITPSVNPLSISESLAVKGAGSLTGESDLDADGVVDTEEQNAPNNGDANFDDLQDSAQDYVASFVTKKGVYATIVASTGGSWVKEVGVIPNPSPENMPKNANFIHGLFQYNIFSSLPGVTVGVFMPVDDTSTIYYKYGPTPDDLTPHWYNFSYDGTTGAKFLGKVEIESVDGTIRNQRMFILRYVDGQRGDDDLTVNGEIINIGGITSDTSSSDESGSISSFVIVLLTILLMLLRSFRAAVEIKLLQIKRLMPSFLFTNFMH